jgi:hypothetical protein
MRVIPHYFASNYSRIGHPVLDAVADDLAALFADTLEKSIPRNLAVLLLELDDDPDPSVKPHNGPKYNGPYRRHLSYGDRGRRR